jgi:hypothetical protein
MAHRLMKADPLADPSCSSPMIAVSQAGSTFLRPTIRGVESVRKVEIFLNLAWVCLALGSICLWLRLEQRTAPQRRLHLIALVMVLVILFPVISVSDDLWSIQNPAETDTSQRRNQIGPSLYLVLPVLGSPPVPLFAPVNLVAQYLSASIDVPAESYAIPPLEGIDNRPPPTA